MGRKTTGKKKITVLGISEEVILKKPKNKNDYYAQKPPLSRNIQMTENFFTSDYFTEKERVAIFLHEYYHKNSVFLKGITVLNFLYISSASSIVIYFFPYSSFLYNFIYILSVLIIGFILFLAITTPLNRKEERGADEFSAKKIDKENLISALKKCYAINKRDVFSDFIYDCYHYPKEKRLKHLSSL